MERIKNSSRIVVMLSCLYAGTVHAADQQKALTDAGSWGWKAGAVVSAFTVSVISPKVVEKVTQQGPFPDTLLTAVTGGLTLDLLREACTPKQAAAQVGATIFSFLGINGVHHALVGTGMTGRDFAQMTKMLLFIGAGLQVGRKVRDKLYAMSEEAAQSDREGWDDVRR